MVESAALVDEIWNRQISSVAGAGWYGARDTQFCVLRQLRLTIEVEPSAETSASCALASLSRMFLGIGEKASIFNADRSGDRVTHSNVRRKLQSLTRRR
jgi:hypothetical protein